jgi:hypothetical protein
MKGEEVSRSGGTRSGLGQWEEQDSVSILLFKSEL